MRIYIFSATYHRLEKTKKSLLSLKKVIDNHTEHDIKLFIGDNNSPQEMKDWLIETFKDQEDHYSLCLMDKNINKPNIINFMWDHCDKNCDVVCSFDSDMVVMEEHQDWLDRAVKCITELPNLGVLSINQHEQCCHLWSGIPHRKEHEGNKIAFGRYTNVAGGCIFMKAEDWKALNGYRRTLPIFGGDDAFIMHDTHHHLKKIVGILEDVYLHHPGSESDDENKYIQWKSDVCHGRQQDQSKGFWD